MHMRDCNPVQRLKPRLVRGFAFGANFSGDEKTLPAPRLQVMVLLVVHAGRRVGHFLFCWYFCWYF